MEAVMDNRRKSIPKLVRLQNTPEYIANLSGSTVLHATRSTPDTIAKEPKKQWGRIKNIDQIRQESASKRDREPGDKENRTPVGVEEFQKTVKLFMQSKKAIQRVRSKYGGHKMRALQRFARQESTADLLNYDLVEMHGRQRRDRHGKLAALQKQFADDRPDLTEKTVKANLEQKIAILKKIKSSNSIESDISDSDMSPKTPTDRRQSNLRKSMDFTDSLPLVFSFKNSGDEVTASAEKLGLTIADVNHELAIAKSREKIEASLGLPMDRLARFAALKTNVNKINSKFHEFVSGKKRNSKRSDLDDLDEEVPYYAPSRFVQQGMALDFFRRYARIVVIVLQWIAMIMHKKYDFEKELKSFVDIANDIEEQAISSTMLEHGLTFDRKFFKANKEISLSAEVRKILTTAWQSRTPPMVKQVMNGLQSLRSLAEYPVNTQEKLCKVAWYQMIGPKKAIIRQGHHAESFYFILSGTAFVKKMVQDPVTGETKGQVAARLTRGHSFGEIGLLFDTLRTATVESASPMELLVIGKEDFVRIFMKAENPDEEADHIKFLRKIPFMSNFPIECLKDEPGACLTHYFKRGTLVTENDRHSEWIYFVMSGTCEVLKKLKAVRPRGVHEIRPRSDPFCDIILPELGLPSSQPRINTGKQRSKQNSINPELYEDMTKFYDSLRRKHEDIYKATPPVRETLPDQSDRQLPKIFVRSESARNSIQENNPQITLLDRKERTDLGICKTDFKLAPLETDNKKRPVSRALLDEKSPLVHRDNFFIPTKEKLAASYRPTSRDAPGADGHQAAPEDVFVMVELLYAKDCFGLNTLRFCLDENDDTFDVEGHNDSPILSLVSRGAEVIMLSKKVLLKYADQRCRLRLRDQIKVYPTETVMQGNMQLEADWSLYKENVLVDYLEKRKRKQDPERLRDQIRVYPTETVMQGNMQLEADWSLYKGNVLVDYLEKRKRKQDPERCKSTSF